MCLIGCLCKSNVQLFRRSTREGFAQMHRSRYFVSGKHKGKERGLLHCVRVCARPCAWVEVVVIDVSATGRIRQRARYTRVQGRLIPPAAPAPPPRSPTGSSRSSTVTASSSRPAPRACRWCGTPTPSCGRAGARGAPGCRLWTPTCASWLPLVRAWVCVLPSTRDGNAYVYVMHSCTAASGRSQLPVTTYP